MPKRFVPFPRNIFKIDLEWLKSEIMQIGNSPVSYFLINSELIRIIVDVKPGFINTFLYQSIEIPWFLSFLHNSLKKIYDILKKFSIYQCNYLYSIILSVDYHSR